MDSVNREEFLDLGTHCSDKSCHQLDFLPFRCQSCALPFCQDHWKPEAHACPKFDAAKADNRIPSCPLCSQPVTFPVGADPNPAMDRHLSTFCTVLNPDAKKPTAGGMPVCHQARCQTKMVVPIRCTDGCGHDFCAAHRYGRDHACPGKQAGPSAGAGKSGMGGLKSKLQSGTAAGEKAGLAALRRAQVAMSTSGGKRATNAKLGTRANPIVIDDNDDDDEVQIISPSSSSSKKTSKTIGLAGIPSCRLLSESEKLQYATEKAREAREGNKGNNGCSM
ncbi:hypothetical protein RQP46_000432 [Phenoliferia psychrophenolica]